MAKFKQTVTREIIDCETGEVKQIDNAKVFTTKIKSDAFYMTFLDFLGPIYNLKSDSAKSILIWLCQHAEFNSGRVDISTAARKEMCSALKITNSTVSNNLKKLKDARLIQGSEGSYIINPQVFWKGELKEREKILDNEDIQISFSIGELKKENHSDSHEPE